MVYARTCRLHQRQKMFVLPLVLVLLSRRLPRCDCAHRNRGDTVPGELRMVSLIVDNQVRGRDAASWNR